MLHREYADVDGNWFSYVRSGDWSNEAILFFHGFIGSKEYFPDTGNDLVCILSFDRPGVGESSVIEYYSMEDFLEVVHDELASHGVTSLNLVGHSAGGCYAQVFAQMYPEMTRSITLASSMVPLNCPDTKWVVGGQWKFIVQLSQKFKGVSKRYFKKMADDVIYNYEKQLASNVENLSEAERSFIDRNPEWVREVITSAVANDGLGACYDAYALSQRRGKVEIPDSIPVYIWHGVDDVAIPVKFVEYFESAYSVESVHVIEGVGHLLYLVCWSDILKEIAKRIPFRR